MVIKNKYYRQLAKEVLVKKAEDEIKELENAGNIIEEKMSKLENKLKAANEEEEKLLYEKKKTNSKQKLNILKVKLKSKKFNE